LLYPELLPQKYQAIRPNESSYEVAQRQIQQQQVAVIDAFALLQSQKDRFPFRFFEPTGSHWNEIGSCLAVRAVGQELAKVWGEEIPDPACEQFAVKFPPLPAETDLIKIANLFNPTAHYRPAPYNTTVPQATLKKKRKVLLVGTSFLFGLEKQLLSRGIADSTTLLFYFRQVRRNGKGNFRSFKPESLTNEELLSYDAIIVDANVASPGAMGYGFLPFVTKRWDLRKLPLPPITGER
jgi:hypothetical protein